MSTSGVLIGVCWHSMLSCPPASVSRPAAPPLLHGSHCLGGVVVGEFHWGMGNGMEWDGGNGEWGVLSVEVNCLVT